MTSSWQPHKPAIGDDALTPQKSAMSILAQIARWIPDKIIGNLAWKYTIQTRAFSADSHVIAMLYAHLSHGVSLNNVCDGFETMPALFCRFGDARLTAGTVCPLGTRHAMRPWRRNCSGRSTNPLNVGIPSS